MPKHVLDHQTDKTDGTVIRRYADVERVTGSKGPHPSTAELQQRSAHRQDSGRMRAYLDIERRRG